MPAKTKRTSKTTPATTKPKVFPAGNTGIVKAVAEARRRGEPSITIKLRKAGA